MPHHRPPFYESTAHLLKSRRYVRPLFLCTLLLYHSNFLVYCLLNNFLNLSFISVLCLQSQKELLVSLCKTIWHLIFYETYWSNGPLNHVHIKRWKKITGSFILVIIFKQLRPYSKKDWNNYQWPFKANRNSQSALLWSYLPHAFTSAILASKTLRKQFQTVIT